MQQTGGVNRGHDPSRGSKLAFAKLHGIIIAVCLWLAFGQNWPDQTRAQILALCATLYFLRHLITLFILLKRKVEMSEVLSLTCFIALFEIGFLLLGAGVLSGKSTPLSWADGLGLVMVLLGSALNTGSELQRWQWKKASTSEGKCYTGGLFAYSMHINYFGDTVLFTGWAILAASVLAWPIPIFITLSFVFYHIPALDAYLAKRYGDHFTAYAARTAKFVPFLY